MKRELKKISSFILVLAMVLAMIPIAGAVAFAEEPELSSNDLLYHIEEFDKNNFSNYGIVAPSAPLYTITQKGENYTIKAKDKTSGGQYLSPNLVTVLTDEETKVTVSISDTGEAKISRRLYLTRYYLTNSFASYVSDIFSGSFGYFFNADGKLVTGGSFESGEDYYIISNTGKYMAHQYLTRNTESLDGKNDNLTFYTTSNVDYSVIDNAVYNGQCQEIFSCGEGLVVDSVNGPDDIVQGATTVGAVNAGVYTITVKPAEGYYWSDWTTDAKSVSVEISQARAEISLILPEAIKFGEAIPEAIITQSGFLEEDFAKLVLSYEAFAALKSPRTVVDLTPGAIMPYFYKGITINYELIYDENDPIYDNYFVRFMLPKPVKVNPIVLDGLTYEAAEDLEYSGAIETLLVAYEHVDITNVDGDAIVVNTRDYGFDKDINVVLATNAGFYEVTLKPAYGYVWADGTSEEKEEDVFIAQKQIDFRFTVNGSVFYKSQLPSAELTAAGIETTDTAYITYDYTVQNPAGEYVAKNAVAEEMSGYYTYAITIAAVEGHEELLLNYFPNRTDIMLRVQVNEELVEGAKVVTGATISGDGVDTTTASIELVFVAGNKVDEVEKASAEAVAANFAILDSNNVKRFVKETVEIDLCLIDGSGRTKVNNAVVVGDPLDVYIPFAWEDGRKYEVAHWDGSTLDTLIPADNVLVEGNLKYLHFQANKFSPFVVLEVEEYCTVSVQAPATYSVQIAQGPFLKGTDVVLSVWAQSEYKIKNVKDLNGNTVVKVSETEYKITNITTNACIAVETEKVESRTETIYVGGGGSSSPKSYKITVSLEGKGSYSLSSNKPVAGDTVTFEPEADKDYVLDKLAISAGKIAVPYAEKDGVYTFVMPSEAVEIKLTFKENKVPAVDVLAPYTDLNRNEWYIPSIRFCVENSYANGTGSTTFEPESTLSRAEVITMLWKMAGQPYVNYYAQIPDVASSDWYAEAVRWAASQKIVNDKMAFDPSAPAPRQVAATFLYRYIKANGGGFSGLWMFNLEAKDKNLIADWALEAVMYLNMKGVMVGNDGYLNPTSTMTRAEMCALLYKFCQLDGSQLSAGQPVQEAPVDVPVAVVEPVDDSKYARYADLMKGAWYETSIRFCLDKNYANGVSEKLFAPDAIITRAEVITMLWKMAGQPYVNYYMQIPDVASGDWYAEAVRWAVSQNIVNDKTAFNPDGKASRQEVATFLYRYIQSKGEGFTGLFVFNLDVSDKDQIASWAMEPCMYLYMKNIMTGNDGKLNPTKLMTRSEMCALICKYENQ